MKRRGGELLRRATVPALALVTAFLIGAILIVLTDVEHLQHIGSDPVGALSRAIGRALVGYGSMASGAIGDPGLILAAILGGDPAIIEKAIWPITETLLSATPLIFVGLALAVSFHAGLFNLGAGGQFLIGGFGAYLVASLVADVLAPGLVLVVGLAGGALFGAAYGFVPGFLKARTGAHEVITTLMLNSIAPNLPFLIASLIGSLGLFGGSPAPLPRVPLIFDAPTIRLDYGFIAALVMAGAASFLLFRTTLGFELRATGFSWSAARGAGIRTGRTTMLAMSLSGGLTGLGSAFYLLGPATGTGGAPPNDIGYVALAIALIAGLRPTGIVLVAVLYGALTNGAKNMGIATGIPLSLMTFVIAIALLFVAAPRLIRSIWRLRPPSQASEATPLAPTGPTHGI